MSAGTQGTYSILIEVKASGLQQLDQVTNSLQKTDQIAKNTGSSLGQAGQGFQRLGQQAQSSNTPIGSSISEVFESWMRLLIRLCSLENSKYEMQYHYHIQGFIYSLLKDSKYSYLHDKQRYKFFGFSNIFPAYDLKRGDLRTLIISSPNDDFIEYISSVLDHLYKKPVTIAMGSMKFEIYDIEKFQPQLPMKSYFSLITGTRIIIRIRKEKYEEFGSKLDTPYDEVYWRSDHPIALFIEQLTVGLSKRHNEFRGQAFCQKEILLNKPLTFLQKFILKKQVSTRIEMKGSSHIVIGTLWEFEFEKSTFDQKLVQFALDCGLGERTSMGFGFMNIATYK